MSARAKTESPREGQARMRGRKTLERLQRGDPGGEENRMKGAAVGTGSHRGRRERIRPQDRSLEVESSQGWQPVHDSRKGREEGERRAGQRQGGRDSRKRGPLRPGRNPSSGMATLNVVARSEDHAWSRHGFKTSRGQPKPEGVPEQKVGKLCVDGGCASVTTAKRDETLGR